MFYFTVALFLSVRDNLPKMVSTKNSVGLFVFTLLFFEFGIMCVLFWFLYFALSIAGKSHNSDPDLGMNVKIFYL
jgi:hypothetical protein